MRRSHLLAASVVLLLVAACASRGRPGAPTTTAPADAPSLTTPASPATAWTTEGGPASPGVPSTGDVVEPANQEARDAGAR